MFRFYTLLKYEKTYGFLTFSGSIDIKYWAKNELIQFFS